MRRHLLNRVGRIEAVHPFFSPAPRDPDAPMPRRFCEGLQLAYGEDGCPPDFTVTPRDLEAALDRAYSGTPCQ